MRKMKRFCMLLPVFFLFLTGCQEKEANTIVKEASVDSITLRVKVDKAADSEIKVHTELVNTGETSLEIIHADPMVGVAIGSHAAKPEIVTSFVGIKKILSKEEAYHFDADKSFVIQSGDEVLYTKASFSIGAELRTIELEIDLDEIG
ncbi:hypothetical protein [Cohnella thailandensis]|uniref:Intracellular proteinase inhibitor BsuPI domain-containing protein n=1 Tax=Cohnella thailandensis TaxID=557557 RepID=A0A841T5L1_9BACL|nr:hypothetical protein [Cohnella thailandensis]MBB6637588.1 hypothetical protein [Cohnella thailandensis]MBP1974236.1 hypothetical protein [Cohnella thailandensis]